MACSTTMSLSLKFFSSSSSSAPPSSPKTFNVVRLTNFSKGTNSLKLSSCQNISGLFSPPILSVKKLSVPQNTPTFTVFAAKGYKLKTHKASAKRFRVTGNGKIVRRRAGKQHLLGKKNTKRKNRLSKIHPVDRADYDNVIKALPYLKVNRLAK
ncbi:hypothetical protein C5167_015630 [Papaver somniferum]|uniref:50S ribosomal protein L35 n=1 Tax=Papaver somniferum TaxID=3469 RepID=A0A4Y7J9Q4_PAPSO|nr:50S ribosomal protein L35, chloroplastic-like [Papaver somniferum]RZC56782.1 hypothetical protein C5167_015630 [Papaver somniferum]